MSPLALYAPLALGLTAGKAIIFFLAILAFVLFGLLDDVIGFSPLPQIFMQGVTSLALLFVFFPAQGNGWWQGALAVFVFSLASMNAMNWLDGLDGLAGSTFFAALLPVAGLFFLQSDRMGLGLILAFLASLVGFLMLNASPAKLYMGTAGSMGLGVFAGIIVATHPELLPALLCGLALPLGDAASVSIQRMFAGCAPWNGGDRRHLHYRLFDKGLSLRKILLLYVGITIFSSLFGIVATVHHTPIVVFFVPLVAAAIISRRAYVSVTQDRSARQSIA